MEIIMWTEQEMNVYSAQLDAVEHLVLLAISKGYEELESVKDFVFICDPSADLTYAESYFSIVKNPSRQVRLED